MLITLLKQLREFEFGILSVFHLRGLGNWNLNLSFLSKWPHVIFHATISSQTSPYDITDWSFSSVHIKFLGSHLHLTNALIFLSALFYFIVILMCLTSPDLMLFSVDFEFVTKIEVLCDTSDWVIPSTNQMRPLGIWVSDLLYISNFVSQLGAKIVQINSTFNKHSDLMFQEK